MWNEDRNWQPLWEAIHDVAERRLFEKHLRPRYLGAVVLTQLKTKTGEVETRQVIDGQQRLTTLQLSFAGMRDVVREMGDDDYERTGRQNSKAESIANIGIDRVRRIRRLGRSLG